MCDVERIARRSLSWQSGADAPDRLASADRQEVASEDATGFFSNLGKAARCRKVNPGPHRKKVLFSFGTRPEAIKLGILHRTMEQQPELFDVRCAVSGQHRDLLDQALDVFSIRPDHDLRVMTANQELSTLSGRIVAGMGEVIRAECPDVVIVQGDTTTALAAALAAFYSRIPVAHVEAGLRTPDPNEPYPEQMNRLLITRLSSIHFAPTQHARNNLTAEGVDQSAVHVSGNTVVDALQYILGRHTGRVRIPEVITDAAARRPIVLVTVHRRENHGEPLRRICSAIHRLTQSADVQVVVCLHPNPNVNLPIKRALSGFERITLVEPLDYISFLSLLSLASLVLSDSGGIQEEAPSLGTPVLVLRRTTERPEAVASGWARLVGPDEDVIIESALEYLDGRWSIPSACTNPFGDGSACERIAAVLGEPIGMPARDLTPTMHSTVLESA